jgi:hypothetical protein
MLKTFVVRALVALALACVLGASGTPRAAAATALSFVGHGAFFSQETEAAQPLDPQVFVADASAPDGVGPQQIAHIAAFRPARLDDDPQLPLYTAQGEELGFTLGKWLGAQGTVEITALPDGRDRIVAHFTKLIAFGVYSLFENHFNADGVTFTPLDGDATANTFTADQDGNASITITTPEHLTHSNAVLLVYHSDAEAHGAQRGTPGVTAHHQLIARVP